jgi:hypothetical protein
VMMKPGPTIALILWSLDPATRSTGAYQPMTRMQKAGRQSGEIDTRLFVFPGFQLPDETTVSKP